MAVVLNPNETVVVFRLNGDVDNLDVEALLKQFNHLLLENQNKVILDLKKVNHISLGGIAHLADRSLRFQNFGGEIKLIGLSPYVANLFKLVGAYSYFDILSDEEEAMARFGS